MKRFFICQFVALTAFAVWWCCFPKDTVSAALVRVTVRASALNQAGGYIEPEDDQITGTVARGFQDMRVIKEIAARHAEWGMSAEAILARLNISPNRLNFTIELSYRSPSAALASAILTALIDERRALDAELQRGQKSALLAALTTRTDELNATLRRTNGQVAARSLVAGDPDDLETQLSEGRSKSAMIEHTLVEFSNRIEQFSSKLELLDAALNDARSGNLSRPFSGFEVFDSSSQFKQAGDSMQINFSGQGHNNEIAGAWVAVMRDSTQFAALQSAYGPNHVRTVEAEAKLKQDRAHLLDTLIAQRNTIKSSTAALTAAEVSLRHELDLIQKNITKLQSSRFDAEFLRLRQTVAGLSGAYQEATLRKQALMSAATVIPAQFFVLQPPVDTGLPANPTPLPVFITLEFSAVLVGSLLALWSRS